jgi:hypothetical protein
LYKRRFFWFQFGNRPLYIANKHGKPSGPPVTIADYFRHSAIVKGVIPVESGVSDSMANGETIAKLKAQLCTGHERRRLKRCAKWPISSKYAARDPGAWQKIQG